MDELDSIIRQINEEFGEGTITTANEIPRPERALEKQAIDDFMERNPMAGGGMLVQPSADGFRQEYSDGPKMTMVRDALDLLPKGSKVSPVDLANQLELSRKLVDNALKEKKYKNKFNVVRKLDALSNQEFIDEYEKFKISDFFKTGKDQEYADYLNDQGFKAEKGDKKFNSHNVAIRRRRLNMKSASDFIAKLSDKQIKEEVKRFNIDTKGLSPEEIREKVLTKRTRENLLKRMEEDPEFAERYREEAIVRSKKRRKKLLSTEEGRAILKDQQRKEKAKKYLKEGLDPPANSAKEMLWKDTVKTAKEDSRFNIVSGYKKSMKKGDYYSNKIKIKDSVTGKTFTFNTLENFINKNAGSFNIKNYEEVIKPYKQKQYINDKGLRNTLNEALIPGWSGGDPRTAYTIQHDFGRKVNPFKVSLAFYDDNSKEYKIRSDFEKAWEKSKTSKTPLADKKLAFNTFKKDIDRLNIRSSPSMITRDRAFGKELDLKSILQKAKKEGAVFKRGTLKEAAEFEKTLASFADSPQCEIFIRRRKADGGRIPYQTGTVSLSDCAKEGAKNFQDGKFKTADQVQDAAKLLSGGRRVLSGLMKYGIIPELAYVGLEAAGRTILGEKPLNAIKKSIDTFTFGLTDFTSGIEAEKFGKFGDLKLDVDKYRNSLAKVNSIQQDIANLETLNTGSQFGYEGDQTEAIQMKKVELEAAKKELQQNMISPDKVSFIDRMSDNIADAQMAKSSFAKASLKDQMDGIPGVADYMDTETARVFPKQPSQVELNLNMLPSFQDYQKTDAGKVDKTIMNAPDEVLKEISPDALEMKKALQEAYKMENLKDIYGAEQIYGTQGVFSQPLAGGGIAKMAGVPSGPPPESGPNSQGLQGLMKRVKNI